MMPRLGPSRPFVFALLLASTLPAAAVASPGAAPERPQSTADPCATAVPNLPNDATSAFAYEITSDALLGFLSQLKSVPERDQKRVFERVAAAAKTAAQQDVERAEQSICPNLQTIYGQTRALVFVANEWTPGEIHDDAKFSDFAAVVGDAVTALANGGELTADQRQTALLPFADLPEAAPPMQQASTTAGTCAEPFKRASTLHAVPPTYPALTSVAGTTGSVDVLLSLNENGDVRSAKPYANSLADKPGSDEAVRAAILSAASSTYGPEIRNCKPVGGKYVFIVKFNRR